MAGGVLVRRPHVEEIGRALVCVAQPSGEGRPIDRADAKALRDRGGALLCSRDRRRAGGAQLSRHPVLEVEPGEPPSSGFRPPMT